MRDSSACGRHGQQHRSMYVVPVWPVKILLPDSAARDRPDRNSPRKSKKVGDFPARKPGGPSIVNLTRYIQFHLLEPWMIT